MDPRALLTNVVVVPRHAPLPTSPTLSAGVVIALAYRFARSNAAFGRSLYRHGANKGLVLFRLLCNGVFVLVGVVCVAKVFTLDLYAREGRGYGNCCSGSGYFPRERIRRRVVG